MLEMPTEVPKWQAELDVVMRPKAAAQYDVRRKTSELSIEV